MIVTEVQYWQERKLLSRGSYGKLKDFEANPRTFKMREERNVSRVPTDDMVKGNIADTLMFAATDFANQFAFLAYDNLTTKAAREQKAAIEASGKRCIRRDWIEDAIEAMLEIHRNNDTQPLPWSVLRPEGVSPEEYVGGLLGPHSPMLKAVDPEDKKTLALLEELSEPFAEFFSSEPADLKLAGNGQVAILREINPELDFHFMGKLDLVPDASNPIWGNWILDLKRTSAGGLKKWLNKVFDFRYHWQAASYLDLYNAEFNEDRNRFGWIVVEDKWPYDCGIVEATPRMINAGRAEYSAAMRRYESALENNLWESPYTSHFTFANDDGIEYPAPVSVDLPNWYSKNNPEAA